MRRNRIRIDQQATYNTLAKLMLGRRVSLAISLFAYLPLQFPRCPVSKQSTHTPITITIMSSPSSLLFLFFFHSSSHYTLHTTTLTHITIYIQHTLRPISSLSSTPTHTACSEIIDRPHAHSLALLLDRRSYAHRRRPHVRVRDHHQGRTCRTAMRKPEGPAAANSCNNAGAAAKLRKGLWSPEEDEKLVAYMLRSGQGSWSDVARNAGLQRCGKSSRLRWINYLRPDLKRGNFTEKEDELIIKLHSLLGNKYVQFAPCIQSIPLPHLITPPFPGMLSASSLLGADGP